MDNAITRSMQPLFDKARQHGLWFYNNHTALWFSPEALERAQSNGKFRWGAVNWELRDPKDHIRELRAEGTRLLKSAAALEQELGITVT